ncbi:MAG: class I mannose-6-phosphate isomerase [Clostridia bacterium]|nr:class I mannose-6-phosphate isomerase [Clostridia bacterium]
MPLAPMLMTPAYRFGAATPWGGEGLRMLFGKEIPDARTGESLEVSAIPGLESRDENGTPLTALIERYGELLTGPGLAKPFPLLLKLLDAKDILSVQVHPDDEYAARVEHKQGKSEAWHILFAAPGAELVYGVKAGVTKEALMEASLRGAAVEALLRRVKVKAGETYAIPAGMVHAIGKGIILYEIQQSSDVTYRFYDWERTDAQGSKRELHLQKAFDVTDVNAQLDAAKETPLGGGRFNLLNEKYFGLDRFFEFSGVLPADKRRFAFLTAIKECRLQWDAGKMTLPAGRTALLPADGYELQLNAPAALLAYPTVK